MRSITSTWSKALPVASALALAGCGGMNGMTGGAPSTAGKTVVLKLRGSGLQNYECRAKSGAAGDYDWALASPEAVLRDDRNAIVGRHYGPTWEHGDGSKVTGKVLATAPSPETGGSIPWLLLEGTPSSAPGAFAGVTRIQRLNTSGGVAPSDACAAATAGAKKSVRYTADYWFYK